MTLLLNLLAALAIQAQAAILDEQTNHPGYLQPNQVTWSASSDITLPPAGQTTGAYVLARHAGGLLLAKHRERGWDIPGGHINLGERPDQTAARETREETGAQIANLEMIAIQRIQLDGPKPEKYVYPYPTSYQILFTADVVDLGHFKEEEDMTEASVFPCAQALEMVPWIWRRSGLRAHFLERLERKHRG